MARDLTKEFEDLKFKFERNKALDFDRLKVAFDRLSKEPLKDRMERMESCVRAYGHVEKKNYAGENKNDFDHRLR